MKSRKRLSDILVDLDYLVAAIALFVLVIVTFMGVIMRYFANNPIIWQEEVQLLCMVWIVFLGASAAVRTGSHIAIDVVVDLMPEKLRKAVEFFGYAVFIGVLVYLLIQGNALVGQLARTNRTTNILNIPYYLIYGVMPVGCVLMVVNQIAYIVKKVKIQKTREVSA